MKKTLFVAIMFFGFLATSEAANLYVRDGGTASNCRGTDWNTANACDQLSAAANLAQRGDTIYVADGIYSSVTFNTAESGSTYIYIKKCPSSAIKADACQNVSGWQDSYGDGQAVFSSVMRFNTGYYVFDGQTRDENDWFDGSAYGFQITHNNNDQNIVISNAGVGANNITIRNVYINALYGEVSSSTCNFSTTTCRRYAVDTDTFGGAIQTGLVFQKMYVYGSNNVWFLRTTNGALVEYSASNGAISNSANHGEVVNLFYSGNNAIIRYNKLKNVFNLFGGGGTAVVAIVQADGLQFYGNVVYDFRSGDASVGFDGYSSGRGSSHNRIYNNTFVGGIGYNSGTVFGTGTDNLVYNNLWVGNGTIWFGASSHDYNGYSGSNAYSEGHAQINISTSIFKNYTGKDFTLAIHSSSGMSLASPYKYDLLGNAFGADGTWDRGAYEFVANNLSLNKPSPPQNLSIQ